MPDALQPFKELDGREQAVRFHGRERRRSLAGIPKLYRTHVIRGASSMAVAEINTTALFPNRSSHVTFKTAIRITENGGQHRGIIFELGAQLRGTAMWVEDDKIGFRAGGINFDPTPQEAAVAIFDNGAELPVGLELELVGAVRFGTGRVRLWGNGRELARAQAASGSFNGTWAGNNNGSFAAAVFGSVAVEVPATSQGAPAGFEVIEPLSVYNKQIPRHFV